MSITRLNAASGRFHTFSAAVLATCLLSGCAANYGALADTRKASYCAAWLTGSAPLETLPIVRLTDAAITVKGQRTVGVAFPKLNLVRVTKGTPEETATRLVHELAHIYGADEEGADYAERNAWRCALG